MTCKSLMCVQLYIHMLDNILIGLISVSKRGLDEGRNRPWVTQEWILKGVMKGVLVNISCGNDFAGLSYCQN